MLISGGRIRIASILLLLLLLEIHHSFFPRRGIRSGVFRVHGYSAAVVPIQYSSCAALGGGQIKFRGGGEVNSSTPAEPNRRSGLISPLLSRATILEAEEEEVHSYYTAHKVLSLLPAAIYCCNNNHHHCPEEPPRFSKPSVKNLAQCSFRTYRGLHFRVCVCVFVS